MSATFAHGTRRSHLSRLWTSRELLLLLAWREIRVRYKQSIMGLGWAVLMPAVIVGAGLIVRVGAAHVSGGSLASSDIASVMVRAVPWAFFVGAIRFGTNSLVSNPSLVTKIAFPKEVFPISAVLSSAFDFAVASGALLVALLAVGWRPTLDALWALPLLAVLALFTTGLALMLSALNLFYRDVKYIVEVLLTYAIFVTPVLFPASFAGPWESVLLLNPLAPIFEALSATVVDHHAPDWPWVAYSTATSVLVLVVGYAWFKRLESLFAERI